MESLRSYLNSLAPGDQERFAISCGTTIGYLRKAISAKQRLHPATCLQIERITGGAVRRADLRPDDAHLIWPDISEPTQPSTTEEAA